jgi:lipopolysaccharide/colanic/teichoic acid biosynthesis glycosyltransferase
MIRRTIDLIFAITALLLSSPVLVVVAIAVIVDSPGNPLYFGWRVGKDGRLFRLWKFRSMMKNADRYGCITSQYDQRITRVGAFLRRTKLDELPQLMNLLLGNVTLVGPRPEAPGIVQQYTDDQRAVLSVKPGITGRVQLESGEESDVIPAGVDAEEYYVRYLMDSKIRRDLEYLRARTPWKDLQILQRTAVYVASGVAGRH